MAATGGTLHMRGGTGTGERMPTQQPNEDLVAYAIALEAHAPTTYAASCDACGHNYTRGVGHYELCPNCVPQADSLNCRLIDRYAWPGHKFVWDECRGPRGRWVLVGDRFLVSRSEFDPIRELLPEGRCDVTFFSLVKEELERLRAIVDALDAPHKERAVYAGKRANYLADECQRLSEKLKAKRAECDELRDLWEDK